MLAMLAMSGESGRSGEAAGRDFELLGTGACHLCEQAEELLLAARGAGFDFAFSVRDISEDEALFQRYGLRIPVLRAPSGAELDWPFDGPALAAFLRAG